MKVSVRDNLVDQANKILKRKMQRAGVYQEIRERKCHKKKAEIKVVTREEKEKKIMKFLKKRMEREGY